MMLESRFFFVEWKTHTPRKKDKKYVALWFYVVSGVYEECINAFCKK